MKKLIALISVFVFLASVAFASSALDLSDFTDEEIMILHRAVLEEIQKRGLLKSATVPIGSYIVGKDIPAGSYSVTAGGSSCGVEVYPTEDSDRYIFDEFFFDDDDGIGKLDLFDGNRLVIEYGSGIFTEYAGIVFN